MRIDESFLTIAANIIFLAAGYTLVYGAIQFGRASRQTDQHGKLRAVYSIVAGGVFAGLSLLVSILF